jgi:MSHA pilin protein MshB
MKNQQGFSLIELVMVIVILGVLASIALPKFSDLSSEAHKSIVAATRGALNVGVNNIHLKWIASGESGAVLDFISAADSITGESLSVNINGWPADTRGTSLTLNSTADCIDIWNAVLEAGAPSLSSGTDSEYQATYNGGNRCTYTYQKYTETTLTITYNSNTGNVVVNN